MIASDNVSLLWTKPDSDYFLMEESYIRDLDISKLLSKYEDLKKKDLLATLSKMPTDEETVLYRQEILKDFLHCEDLLKTFKGLADKFYEASTMVKFAFEREYTLYNVLKRLEESDAIIKELYKLSSSLADHTIESKGLNNYKEMLDALLESDLFSAYLEDLTTIRKMTKVSGIKIGLNLDSDLAPSQAIVLSLEENIFKYSRGMKKFSRKMGQSFADISNLPRRLFAPDTMMVKEDLNELEKIIEPAMQQLINFSDNFNKALMEKFGHMGEELMFYDFGCRVKEDIEASAFKMTQITFDKKKPMYVKGIYNLNLLYRLMEESKSETLVMNDLNFDGQGNIFVLTGANRGGKTTFTQGVGQLYWFGMLGLYVGAAEVNVQAIDGLYIHFPEEEIETVLFGRLGEECGRFSEIFKRMTKKSLILMNESFAGTSYLESLTIAKESLSALQVMGATCLFNTHLHELALQVNEMNEGNKMVRFKNLISGSEEDHQSFKINEGQPLGKSYAYDIAKKYGVTLEQLLEE